MTKAKILLAGKNSSVIDDLFNQLSDDYEFMTTSMRKDDMNNHIRMMKPTLFIYCIGNEEPDMFHGHYSYYDLLRKNNVWMAIIGSEEACEEFTRVNELVPDIILRKPLTASGIRESINGFLAEQERIAKEIEEQEAAIRAAREAEEEKNRQRHVLVVDDDPMMLKLIKEHLKDIYVVAAAPSGKVALKFLENKTTDLVLLDFEMPEMNGPEVLKAIRENPNHADIPVVFLTGVSEKAKISEALALKPQSYILKPIERERLLSTIKDFIR